MKRRSTWKNFHFFFPRQMFGSWSLVSSMRVAATSPWVRDLGSGRLDLAPHVVLSNAREMFFPPEFRFVRSISVRSAMVFRKDP